MGKHNKKRNTAFIYETLLREVVKQTVAKNKEKRDTAISILKESFAKGTELRKELDLYKILMTTTNLTEKLAERVLNETTRQHLGIDQNKLFKEQSAVISQVNKELSKATFSNFVPNYKNLATIAQIFASNMNPKSKVLLEAKVVKNMISSPLVRAKKAPKANGLVMKAFVDRFNNTYTELFSEQKETLNHYIKSFSDDGTEFRYHLNEEIGRLKEEIATAISLQEIKEDKNLHNKIKKVSNLLEDFNKSPLNEEGILLILKVQSLAREFKSE